MTPTVTIKAATAGEFAPDYVAITIIIAAHTSKLTPTLATRQVNKTAKNIKTRLGTVKGTINIALSNPSITETQAYNASSDQILDTGFDVTIIGLVQASTHIAEIVTNILLDEPSVTIAYVVWGLGDDTGAYRKVRTAALTEARLAAEDYAHAANMTVGALHSITDTSPITLPMSLTNPTVPTSKPFGLGASETINLDPEPVRIIVTVDVTYELTPIPTPAA